MINAGANPAMRIRWRRRAVLALGAVFIAVLIAADQRGWLLVRQNDDVAVYHGRQFGVTRIIDGDTLEVDCADPLNARAVTRVRLWGANCPELPFGGRTAEPLAIEAMDFTKQAIAAGKIRIWLQTQQTRDPFGAVLAHIELASGENLAEQLLQSGFAKADDRWPHLSLVRFTQLESAAKRDRLGIWSSQASADAYSRAAED